MDRERGERFIARARRMGRNEIMTLDAALADDQDDSLLLGLRFIVEPNDALRLLRRL